MQLSGSLGERIAKLRTIRRISQKELADYLFVNQGTVSRWEKGIRFPEEDLIQRMVTLFQVDAEVLTKAPLDSTPSILVLDEGASLENTGNTLKSLNLDAEILLASSVLEANALAKKKPLQVIFIEPAVQNGSGLVLAEQLAKHFPDTNLVFLSAYPGYMDAAFRLHASGYMLKPAFQKDFIFELRHLRHPVARLADL